MTSTPKLRVITDRPTIVITDDDEPTHVDADRDSLRAAVEALAEPNLRRYRHDEEVRFAVKRARLWSQAALDLLRDK